MTVIEAFIITPILLTAALMALVETGTLNAGAFFLLGFSIVFGTGTAVVAWAYSRKRDDERNGR